VTATIDHQGDRATVAVSAPAGRRPPYRVSVSYFVTAPPGTRVTATSLLGDVTLRNLTGEISALVTSGNIAITGARRISSAKSISGNVTLTAIETDEAVNAGTMAGDVVLDRVKARRLEVDVTAGNVRATDVESRNAEVGSLSGSIDYSGRLVSGGRYEFRAHSGGIRLTMTGAAGFELQANSFSGQIRPAANLSLQSASRTRNSLRGSVGDGSAIVVATTFSGNIEIATK
jgi:DUF4097 and DUF4098 domain-containing protein YvlB